MNTAADSIVASSGSVPGNRVLYDITHTVWFKCIYSYIGIVCLYYKNSTMRISIGKTRHQWTFKRAKRFNLYAAGQHNSGVKDDRSPLIQSHL